MNNLICPKCGSENITSNRQRLANLKAGQNKNSKKNVFSRDQQQEDTLICNSCGNVFNITDIELAKKNEAEQLQKAKEENKKKAELQKQQDELKKKAEQTKKEETKNIQQDQPIINKKSSIENINGKIIALIKEGRKIEAIKVYKDEIGCSLSEAKSYIDNIEKQINPQTNINQKTQIVKKEKQSFSSKTNFQQKDTPINASGNVPQFEKIVMDVLKTSSEIDAIKVYRKLTNCDLQTAKNYVESIKAKYNLKTKKGCFIATACYDSYNHENVLILRQFRDNVLAKSLLGNSFISVYYFFSPRLALMIYPSERLKNLIKRTILNPIVQYIKHNYK